MLRASLPHGIELEYETFGDDKAPTLVLVMGLGMQMTAWDTRFCVALAGRGFRVVRFDNRDVGRSSKLDHLGFPDLGLAMGGDPAGAAYSIEDMARDVAAFIDVLGVKAAHLVGASMGGFIVQAVAIEHPEHVLSVASIMSSTGDRAVGQPRPEALAALMTPAPLDREAAIDHAVGLWRTIGSPSFAFDEARIRRRAGDAWDRDHDPLGVLRQATAVFTQRDRTPHLARVRVPAVVIHGAEDPLVTLSGGEATAAAIPGSRLVVVPGMGHDLVEAVWPTILDAIVDNARRAVA